MNNYQNHWAVRVLAVICWMIAGFILGAAFLVLWGSGSFLLSWQVIEMWCVPLGIAVVALVAVYTWRR